MLERFRHVYMVWVRRSARRWARNKVRQLSRLAHLERAARSIGDVVYRGLTSEAFLPLLFVGITLATLYVGDGLPSYTSVVELKDRAGFLSTLWQVLAAALALVIDNPLRIPIRRGTGGDESS
jgi:hypothetical protein